MNGPPPAFLAASGKTVTHGPSEKPLPNAACRHADPACRAESIDRTASPQILRAGALHHCDSLTILPDCAENDPRKRLRAIKVQLKHN
jgi:hypothetical protein